MHLEHHPPPPDRPSRKGKERDPSHPPREAQVTDLDEKIIALRRKTAGCVAFPPVSLPDFTNRLFPPYLPGFSGHGTRQSESVCKPSSQIPPHRAPPLSCRRQPVAQNAPPRCVLSHPRHGQQGRRRGRLPVSFPGPSSRLITKSFHAG